MRNNIYRCVIFQLLFSLFIISYADVGIGISDIGTLSSITSIERESTTPDGYRLKQNYPNPFNPITEIAFCLGKSSFVKLEIYDSIGQIVTILINHKMTSGNYKVKFNASGLSSGIYYYKIHAEEFQSIKKMLLLQ